MTDPYPDGPPPEPDRDLDEYLRDLLEETTGPINIVRLTDEELLAHDGIKPDDPLLLPHLNQGDLDERTAVECGARSLIARGLVLSDADRLRALPHRPVDLLAMITAARVAALGFIQVRQAFLDVVTTKVASVQPAGVVQQQIDPDGFHEFSALSYDQAAHDLARWVADPGPARPGQQSVPAARWEAWIANELGDEIVQTEFTCWRLSRIGELSGVRWVVSSGEGGSILSVEADDDQVTVSPTRAQDIEARLTGVIADMADDIDLGHRATS